MIILCIYKIQNMKYKIEYYLVCDLKYDHNQININNIVVIIAFFNNKKIFLGYLIGFFN